MSEPIERDTVAPETESAAAPERAEKQPRISLAPSARKSPLLALVLSALPGLGQVYTGYYRRGFIHAIIAGTIITLLVNDSLGPLVPLGSLFLSFFWLYNMVDAARRATLINEALAGRSTLELPEDFDLPGLRGSLPGGVALVVLGIVLLMNTRFGVSLEWIEDWWPVAVIGFGGYLIYKAKQERPTGTSSYDG